MRLCITAAGTRPTAASSVNRSTGTKNTSACVDANAKPTQERVDVNAKPTQAHVDANAKPTQACVSTQMLNLHKRVCRRKC